MTASSAAANGVAREREVRERIFNSALRHFSRKGYSATSLREICEDAQTTKPMVYYYFGSKEGLYSGIVNGILEEMANSVRGDAPGNSTPRAKVRSYCGRYMDHFLAKEETIALVLREVFGLGGAPMAAFGQGLARRVRQPLDDILAQGMESGAFRRDDIEACATAVTGILNMFILSHVFGGDPIDREATLRQVDYYTCGIGAG